MSESAEYRGLIRVIYPASGRKLVLRTEADWERDVEPVRTRDGERFDFEVTFHRPYIHFKPCLLDGEEVTWSTGANKLVMLGSEHPQSIYPHFGAHSTGRITDAIKVHSPIMRRDHRLRIYLPGGYDDNTLKRYPVLYMQDGANVFFPQEAFLGREWQVDETLDLCNRMNLIDQVIVVGIHAADREADYTQPGYEAYGRSLVTELKPHIDRRLRTLPGSAHTMAMGSSLGGVVSFFLGWQWPTVFSKVACLSSTFSHRDDLVERVSGDELGARSSLRIYLDSGWPGDNYERTLSMATTLVERGFELGRNVHHLAFPLATHDEGSWAARLHLPLQLFAGRLQRASEHHDLVAPRVGE